MVFNGSGLADIIFFVLIAWVAGLSFIVLRMIRHYNRLTGDGQTAGLKDILEGLLMTQKGLREEQKALFTALDEIKKDGKLHVQRVGLVRFNPFSDTGGSQSFTLAVLDGHGSGLVMTSLYARSGNRWYVKEVAMGKGKELALSKEEQAAIRKAYE
jgi:hypothetical protein